MKKYTIDINADVGEGVGNESELLPLISSCNIACGGHAGDLKIMEHIVDLAKKYNVKIGAHPSFPDQLNFGRTIIKMTDKELFESLKHQILTLKKIVTHYNTKLNHIKPHGALYNLAVKNENTAMVIVDVIKNIDNTLKLYAPYNSSISNYAQQNGVEVVFEAFADRNYNEDFTLVSRQKQNALILDKQAVFEHVKSIVLQQKITTINGNKIGVKADTICVHGDSPNALKITTYLCDKLTSIGVIIE